MLTTWSVHGHEMVNTGVCETIESLPQLGGGLPPRTAPPHTKWMLNTWSVGPWSINDQWIRGLLMSSFKNLVNKWSINGQSMVSTWSIQGSAKNEKPPLNRGPCPPRTPVLIVDWPIIDQWSKAIVNDGQRWPMVNDRINRLLAWGGPRGQGSLAMKWQHFFHPQ